MRPGQLRDGLVVLGRDLATARFVPPPEYEVGPLIDDLQHYLKTEREAALVKLAIAHYQFDALFNVSATGAWEAWILFFLRGVAQQARDAAQRMRRLVDLRQDYHRRVSGPRASHGLVQLIDDLFIIPACSVPGASRVLKVSYNAARESVRKLENAQILERSDSHAGKSYWVASEIIRTLEEPLSEENTP